MWSGPTVYVGSFVVDAAEGFLRPPWTASSLHSNTPRPGLLVTLLAERLGDGVTAAVAIKPPFEIANEIHLTAQVAAINALAFLPFFRIVANAECVGVVFEFQEAHHRVMQFRIFTGIWLLGHGGVGDADGREPARTPGLLVLLVLQLGLVHKAANPDVGAVGGDEAFHGIELAAGVVATVAITGVFAGRLIMADAQSVVSVQHAQQRDDAMVQLRMLLVVWNVVGLTQDALADFLPLSPRELARRRGSERLAGDKRGP